MTNADFMADDDQFIEEEPDFPEVFGIQMSPITVGVLLGLLGVGGAVFAYLQLLSPRLAEQTVLNDEVTTLEQQVQDPETARQAIDAANARVQEAEQLQADVLALFADETTLETLLLDINGLIESANLGVAEEAEDRLAVLSRFDVNRDASGLIEDGSLGEAVNGRLNRLIYNLEMEGSYAQTQSILRGIERLQPLLVVNNFRTEVQPVERLLALDGQGNLVQVESPQPRLRTSFQLDALAPAETPPPSPEGEEGETPAEGT
ncbi:MAG: pilus assembly protein PilO [Cyanothece sp. SIO2G6]|nr:pilus assembly protein PilO [Cyanothece sp. SIO2G6]